MDLPLSFKCNHCYHLQSNVWCSLTKIAFIVGGLVCDLVQRPHDLRVAVNLGNCSPYPLPVLPAKSRGL
jgi:hypothetical protein